MGNHLHGAGSFEQVPVDGHETPAEIGDDASGESESEVRLQSFDHLSLRSTFKMRKAVLLQNVARPPDAFVGNPDRLVVATGKIGRL